MKIMIALLLLAGVAYAGPSYIEEQNDSEGLAADARVVTASTRLSGISIRESAGSAAVATVVLRNAADTDSGTVGVQCAESGGTTQVGGAAVAYIELAANGSQNIEFIPPVSLPQGMCADILAGTVDIQAYFTND